MIMQVDTLHLKVAVIDDMSPSLSKVVIDKPRVNAGSLVSAGRRWKM